ncbi:helix-turn-helix domain-containing protein [Chitinophaga rhizophila]|uniref:AraC family transcriptional regulator n=1 Tax=Chitinophaga rhizophila TaxID=2866212 RepID=A0ABS7G6Q4_9BACT|nr:AraC family transcriptional regulator [Chitinophaga rhizophila]MBW8683335.1 AraC family transcriptional regulator [Chitinophaga rhizophila]
MKNSSDIPLHTLPELPFLASDQRTAFGEHWSSHRIDFYAVIWFTEDADVHFIDFEPYPVRKHTIYLLGQHQVHAIPAEVRPKANIIVFSAAFFHRIEEPFLRQLFLPFDNRGIIVPPDMCVPLTHLFNLIVLENNGVSDLTLLLKYTTAFLWHLYRFASHQLSYTAGEDSRISKLYALLQTHFTEERSAGFYAQQLGLTTKRINEILRGKTGMTISQLLYQLLLIEAKRALFHGEMSVKEIAYQLGFADQSYFARFFKKHTGITPEQFREKESPRLQTL